MSDWFRAYFELLRFSLVPHRGLLAGVVALVLLCNGTEIMWPEILKLYVDSYGDVPMQSFGIDCSPLASDKGRLLWLPLMLVGVAVIRWITNFARIIVQGLLAQRILVAIRARIYERMQRESFSFHDRCHSGSLITNLVEDVRFSTVFFQNAFFDFIEAVCFIVLAWAMIWRVFPASGMAVAGAMMASFAIASFLFRRNLPRFIATRSVTADMVRKFNEYVEGRLLIQAYGMNNQIEKEWRQQVTDVQDYQMREVFWQIVMHQVIMWGALISTFTAVAAYLIVSRNNGTVISDGVLVYMISILIIHLQRVRQFLGATDNTMRFMVTAVRLREFLGGEFGLPKNAPPTTPFRFESLEFRNVSFSYIPDREVLRNVSFRIDKPSMLGIAGLTGSGKSTVVQLATGLYQPDSGQILLNGKPLTDWDPGVLRHASAIVFQDVFLFSGSVRENVAFGLDDPNSAAIDRALADAEAMEFIDELPQGTATEIGEKGVSLSGGQRQRLSLARALAREPGILALDSCTSALDTETEARVLDNIHERHEATLSIVISHRPGALARADQVLIMEDGRVAAFAPPKQLRAEQNPAWLRATLSDAQQARDTGGIR